MTKLEKSEYDKNYTARRIKEDGYVHCHLFLPKAILKEVKDAKKVILKAYKANGGK
jgi:hypothetical protein